MIEISHVAKAYAKVVAVDDVSLQAEDGRITGLLGPNGAGKTTTLRMLYGLIQPDRGHVSIDGVDSSKDPIDARRRIGVLPDSHGLYPRMTAREHIRYFGRLQGLEAEVLEPRIEAMIELLEMRSIADRRAAGFSQGERMKVSLARALVHEPKNIILDEPTNGLDVMSTRAVRSLIRDLRGLGKCVLFSSHIMQEVSALCDEIVIMAKGRVVARGSVESLQEETGQATLEDAFVVLAGEDLGDERGLDERDTRSPQK